MYTVQKLLHDYASVYYAGDSFYNDIYHVTARVHYLVDICTFLGRSALHIHIAKIYAIAILTIVCTSTITP